MTLLLGPEWNWSPVGVDDSARVVYGLCVVPSHDCHVAGSSSTSVSQRCVNATLHGAHVAADSDVEWPAAICFVERVCVCVCVRVYKRVKHKAMALNHPQ